MHGETYAFIVRRAAYIEAPFVVGVGVWTHTLLIMFDMQSDRNFDRYATSDAGKIGSVVFCLPTIVSVLLGVLFRFGNFGVGSTEGIHIVFT